MSLVAYDRPTTDYGVRTYDISYGARASQNQSKWKYLLAGVKARKLLREIKPDILHGHYATSAGVISLITGFRPFVLTVHGTDLMSSMHSVLWRRILRTSFRKAALVNTVSRELAVKGRDMGIEEEKLLVATLGVDTEQFSFRGDRRINRPLKLLCTRTLGEIYDPETVLNACRLLKEMKIAFRMTFAAGGPLEAELKKRAKKLAIEGAVTFMGGYDNSTLPDILHRHDIYVSASHWDGTSISLLEAMSAGTFPVVSRIKSNRAWLKEDQTALMFDCENSRELAEKIRRIENDRCLFENAVLRNRKLVEEQGDRIRNLERLEEAYYRILEE